MTESIIKLKEFLTKKNIHISVAESLTAGLLQTNLASASGASNFFNGGITTYTIDSKVSILGVDRLEAEEHNAVSPLVAAQMALGVCKLFNSEIGIGTTGYAEPDIKNKINIPFAYIAISIHKTKVYVKRVESSNLSRNEMREFVTEQALAFLLNKLQ